MSEGITGNQIEAGVVTFLSRTVELTDAQIKALPTTPIVIVPATEVLNYAGLPTQVPLPLAFRVSVNTLAGAYTNVNGLAHYVLALGSDWSADAMQSATQNQMAQLDANIPMIGICNSYQQGLDNAMIAPLKIPSGGLQDNALAIVFDNEGSGNLTGGNAANSMKVTVLYTIIDV